MNNPSLKKNFHIASNTLARSKFSVPFVLRRDLIESVQFNKPRLEMNNRMILQKSVLSN